jgi:pimeloyl-ACP methyl ester carboxylesterase
MIVEGIQGSELCMVPQGGHWLHVMAPEFIHDKLLSIF